MNPLMQRGRGREKKKIDVECMNAEVLHNSMGTPLLQEADESLSGWVCVTRRASHCTYERGSSNLVFLL